MSPPATADAIARIPRSCCTTTWTVACALSTIVELAAEVGYDALPTTDPEGWPRG